MFRKIILSVFAASALAAFAVTDKEMQQAEAITAKQYLRWSNDGSGYLDEITVSSLTELQGKLRTQKDKDNLQVFKSAANPGDYASWTKEQLVTYWSDTFFRSPKLSDKGRGAKSSVKSKLNALQIAAPQPKAETAEKKDAPKDTVTLEPSPAQKSPEELAAEQAALDAQADSIAMARAELLAQPKEEPSDLTPVYIIVLCVLVALVIFLVVYASKMMGKNGSRKPTEHSNNNLALEEENRRLRSELAETRRQLHAATEQLSAYQIAAERTSPAPIESTPPAPRRQRKPAATPAATNEPARENIIYLGRVNKDGLFVRADRNPAPGHTIFLLRTDDGFTGSFRVVNNPEVWQLCLDNPERNLMGGAEGDMLEDTDGFNRVVNQGAGTAIFEDGCWRVLRKASVGYA